jgi:hypothetical protein
MSNDFNQNPNQNNPEGQPPFNPQQPQQPQYQPPFNPGQQPPFNPQQPQQPQYQPPFNPAGQPMFTPSQPPAKKKRSKLGIGCLVVIVLIVLIIIISAVNSGNNSAKTDTPAATAVATTTTSKSVQQSDVKPTPTAKPKPAFASFGDGMFQVGKDIKAGTYRTRTGSVNCYYSRLSGFTGALDEILANDNTSAPAVVTIASSDKGFQSTGCGTWTADLSQITKSKTSFGDGEYIIGTDIEPGTYKSSGSANCYYARLSGFGGTLDEVLDNNNTDTAAIVTIAAGDKGFQATRCGTWTKM